MINFKMAWNAIKASKLRSILTMTAVIIGVMGYMLITTTVEGLKASTVEEINALGGNLVAVNSGKLFLEDDEGKRELNPAAFITPPNLTQRDFDDLMALDKFSAGAQQAGVDALAKRGDKDIEGALIFATNEDYPAAFNQKVEQGEFFKDSDRNRLVIGQGVVDDYYVNASPLGSTISVGREDFVVVGVMEEFDLNLSFGIDPNKVILIPIKAAAALSGTDEVLSSEFDFQVKDDVNIDELIVEMEAVLLENHGGQENFTVSTQDDLVEFSGDILDLIKNAAVWISYIMLFVGAVVILLIMLIAVNERIREIGIRKSIGAKNSSILWQFMIEAIMLSWTGAVIGVAIAWAIGFIIRSAIDITPVYSLNTVIAVVIISTLVGTIAGLYPAWSAARKNPIEALRHE
ncbi:MAG: ABC transporter permease [Candidatus Saccharimonadales bacterium]|nr:ABC transporter permease [Candidatus Saccharimonadales bacterium]